MRPYTQFLMTEEVERINDLIEILESKQLSPSFEHNDTEEERKSLKSNLNTLKLKKKRIEARANCQILGFSRN